MRCWLDNRNKSFTPPSHLSFHKSGWKRAVEIFINFTLISTLNNAICLYLNTSSQRFLCGRRTAFFVRVRSDLQGPAWLGVFVFQGTLPHSSVPEEYACEKKPEMAGRQLSTGRDQAIFLSAYLIYLAVAVEWKKTAVLLHTWMSMCSQLPERERRFRLCEGMRVLLRTRTSKTRGKEKTIV